MVVDELVDRAAGWAETFVSPLGRRWSHVQAVASKAARVAETFDATDGRLLVAAAWLHDVGYAEDLAFTGFHPLDGARFVRRQGVADRVALLVAHHSGARVEAQLRGIAGYGKEFPFVGDALDAALTFCDLTTGPDGADVSLGERVAEINRRYGGDHVTARAIRACVPELKRFVLATQARLSPSKLAIG